MLSPYVKKRNPFIVNCLECGKKIPSNVTACPYCDCLAKWAIPEEYQEEPIFYLPTSRVAPPESEHRPTCNHKNGIGFGIGGGVLLGDIDV